MVQTPAASDNASAMPRLTESAWVGAGLQALAFVVVLWLERWNGAWSIGVFFALSATFLLMQERLPSLFARWPIVRQGAWQRLA